jgi:O-methyltransferase
MTAGSPPPATTDDIFETAIYASTLTQKLRRGLDLGPRYYLLDLPRYFRQRRQLGLPLRDLGVFRNPVRSFQNGTYHQVPLPPHYDEALALLGAAGVRFDNQQSRIEALAGLWWQSREAAGEVIECGAYRGGTSLLLAVLGRLNGITKKVLMLDTFSGIPAPSTFDSGRQGGEFEPPEDWPSVIRQQAAALGVDDVVEVHVGLFSDSFPAIGARDLGFSFCHIDANIYEGTLQACEFTLPRVPHGGVVVFDDYNGLCDLGARLAIDVALQESGRRPQPLAECSAYLQV